MKLNRFIITWFGCGLVPLAPGTMGTIGTVPLAWILAQHFNPIYRLGFALILTGFSFWVVGIDQIHTEVRDPQYVVIDETIGYLLSTVWLPARWETFLLAFILFRILDVVKPFPANYFDRCSKTANNAFWRGAHIVLDDVVAGLYAAFLCWIVFTYFYILPL